MFLSDAKIKERKTEKTEALLPFLFSSILNLCRLEKLNLLKENIITYIAGAIVSRKSFWMIKTGKDF